MVQAPSLHLYWFLILICIRIQSTYDQSPHLYICVVFLLRIVLEINQHIIQAPLSPFVLFFNKNCI